MSVVIISIFISTQLNITVIMNAIILPANLNQSINLVNKMTDLKIRNFGIDPKTFSFPLQQWALFNSYIKSNAQESLRLLVDGVQKDDREFLTVRSFRISAKDCKVISEFGDRDLVQWIHSRQGYSSNRKYGQVRTHGELLENPAMAKYASLTGFSVKQVKLLVNPSFPFLVCQADGIAFNGDVPSHIIEVKTMPQSFKNNRENPQYTKLANGSWTVRYDSEVYKQVQINMFLSNLLFADVVLFNESTNSIHAMRVVRNDKFLFKFINKIYSKLQSIVLPAMVQKFIQRNK